MKQLRPWWQDAEKLAWLTMSTLVVCACSLLLAGTYVAVHWIVS